MKPELKSLYSIDVDDLDNYRPEDPDKFCICIRALVGPKGMDGEESFDIQVCTPKWLEETFKSDEVIMGRGFLIVQNYHYEKIEKSIKTFCATVLEKIGMKLL